MDATLTPASLPQFARTRWWPWVASAPFVLWPAASMLRESLRWEVVGIMVLAPFLAFYSPKTRLFFTGLLPIGLVGLLYDAMKYVKNVGLSPGRVHICDIQRWEAALFGYTAADGARETVHAWIQRHPNVIIDVACAIPYGTYIYGIFITAIVLFAKDFLRMQRFAWTFLFLNLAGFITYHVFPAAPPWYVHAHGCVLNLAAHSEAGANLTRIDELIHFPYFHGLYGRSNDVYGAVPSLHVAYPSLILLEAWGFMNKPVRVLFAGYAAAMIVGAVWLDHHWVIDVLLGLGYTGAIVALVRRLYRQPAAA